MKTNERSGGQKRGQVTRNDIVEVARRLISDHGYHATGISDIQSATGLTKGAFYHHFSSKEDVALAVLDQAENDYADRLFDRALECASAREGVMHALESQATLNGRAEWCNCRLMATLCAEITMSDGRLRARVLDLHQKLHGFWVNLLSGCAREGALREGMTPEKGAQLVVSSTMGAMTAKKIGNARVDLNDLGHTLSLVLLDNGA